MPGFAMNGVRQGGKNRNLEKRHPGCLGKMVNLFELNTGASANRLLTDKPHPDGSPLSRSRSDVPRMSPSRDPVEKKVVVSEYKNRFSNRKSHGTPMKMLIDKEMSKEVNSRHDPPNLVAKLMGLDALPQQEPDAAIQRSHSRGRPQSHSDIPIRYWEKQSHYGNPNECPDFYELWQQSQELSHEGRYEEAINDKKMALVHQKFLEVKRLSMDEKLRQSKQFHDALEVLSSNKDLFLKCLQEPNSMLHRHRYNHQSVTPPPETKRITVLRPSKMADSNNFTGAGNEDGKQMKESAFLQLNEVDKIHPGSSPPARLKYYENPTQPTQIVVLKPSPGRPHNHKAVSHHSEAQRMLPIEDFFGDVEDDESKNSREIAKAITQQIRKKLGRHRRDETLISSVFSNGYVGDESSFNKSEIEYADGDLGDSEVMSPASRHSWDYGNRLDSPYSSASFSRASYSPESTVCREAKRRLSERWAMMASNGSCQEPKHAQRRSSTLGEMLALSEAKKAVSSWEGCSSKGREDSNSLVLSGLRLGDNVDGSPRNLMRSKSVPVSSTEFGTRLNIGISMSDKGMPVARKEDTKARSVKSSFKGKVSSLFFSRNKKPGKDGSLESERRHEFHTFAGDICNDRTESLSDKGSDNASPGLLKPSTKTSTSSLIGKQGLTSPEANLAAVKPIAPRIQGDSQDHLSPISVLDQPFGEDEHTANVFPHHAKPDQHGVESQLSSIGSNLIDKSPLIGSIARTLSWDDSCLDTASSHVAKESLTIRGRDEEEREWLLFVKTLLSVAGLHGEVKSNLLLARWHSLESPLDPLLRDKYIDLQDKETLHEANQRRKRTTQKLVFDCVNEALVEIAIYGLDLSQRAVPHIGADNCTLQSGSSTTLLDEVWARMKALFSDEVRYLLDDCGDENSLVVESAVRKGVAGKGWIDQQRSERDSLGKEIEENLLRDLVQEAVVELTGRA